MQKMEAGPTLHEDFPTVLYPPITMENKGINWRKEIWKTVKNKTKKMEK